MRNVLEYIENTVAKMPEKIAVIDESHKISYQDLLINSKKIGSYLSDKIEAKNPIPVFMDKSIETLSSFFGIVYAGCFYILINPELPTPRIEQIIKVVEPKIIITDYKHKEQAKEIFKNTDIKYVEDLLKTEICDKKIKNIREKMISSEPLYANFTSGSTGIPKGVVVSHRTVIDFIENFTQTFNITEKDIIGNQAPFDFDVSVKDIYSSIKKGATLVIIPKRLFSSPAELLDYICKNRVTTMIWAVSALCLITTFHGLDYKVPKDVNKVLFSGEIMPIKHLKQWMEHLPNAMFVNLYGPTEITCNCTYHIIDKNRDYQEKIPIGKPFINEKVFLLDENNKEILEKDKIGEICVGDTAIALGYYNNKEQTEKSFVQNPLNDKYIEYIYRTGDLGKYGEDNEMYFMGRKDFQIKYLGHRIELEEIEKAMMQIEEVKRACCIFDEKKSKLYGFYVGEIDKKELHKILKQTLPIYMIPGMLKNIENMPLTKNGKIDRKELYSIIGGERK